MEKPYQGQDPYLFLSYSHNDMNAAVEIVSALQNSGYRVWYDEGIDPGTEWDEIVASHVESCSYFVALISQNYLASDNCKDELNFARDLNKSRLLVYLERVELPAGMQMRLSRLQAIYQYRYSEPNDFYKKLETANGMDACKSDSVPQTAQEIPPALEKTTPLKNVEAPAKPFEAEELGFGDYQLIPMHKAAMKGVRKRTGQNAKNGEQIMAHGEFGRGFAWEINRAGLLRISGEGILPDVESYIDTPWNMFRKHAAHLVISSGITRIGNYLFEGFSGLTELELPGGLLEIGDYAFRGCWRLNNLRLPDSLKCIGGSAFSQCSGLTELNFPDSLKYIGGSAFSLCSGLTELTLPDNLEEIPACAFTYSSLIAVKLPAKLKVVRGAAFSGCGDLVSVDVPMSLKLICSRAFTDCGKLRNIVLPKECCVENGAFARGVCITRKTAEEDKL